MITIVLIGGVLLLILLALLVGVFLFLRGRATSENESAEPNHKAKKSTRKKTSSKRPAQKQAKTDRKSPHLQSTKSAPVAPPPARSAPPGEKIRILIVDDNAGTRENVTRLLYFEDDLEVVGQATNGLQGLEMTIELKPHIVLMDINMPDMDGITATQKMGVDSPFSQVIIMSVQADPHYMKRAMAAGARDFQPKPFTSEELVSCIRRVYNIGLPKYRQFEATEQALAQQAAQPAATAKTQKGARTPVIVVYSPKGGVGTSAIAGNLAVTLQQEQGDAILMDADFQFGDVMVHLNARSPRTVSDLVHENGLEVDLLPEILIPHNSGLKLLLGPPKPEWADKIIPGMVSEIINGLKNQFKVVIIDTESQLTNQTQAVFDSADYILAVAVPELPAIKDVKLFLEMT